MKQVLQSVRTGQTELADVPCPSVRAGHVLVATRRSLISAGTERMVREFGAAGWLGKIRRQPDKVRRTLDKIRTDGLLPALEAVRSQLGRPIAMGYSNVGTVLECGSGVTGFEPGDRVVSNGPHAEAACVPKNLCAKVPDAVSDDEAAFTVLGAIALEGLRLAEPTLGETFCVTGLGLVGLLTVQLLQAQGCRVLGVDLDRERLQLAAKLGAETVDLSQEGDAIAAAERFSRGRGVDGVLIAAATRSNEPIRQAARMCRKRGRIVLVGVTGLELSRGDFYEKELLFRVSCSYGPGRHEPDYEEGGRDYPAGLVRWTAGRNFEAVLDLLATRRLDVEPLISHRFPLERVGEAYAVIDGSEASLGVLLEYGGASGGIGGIDVEGLRRRTLRVDEAEVEDRGGRIAGRSRLPGGTGGLTGGVHEIGPARQAGRTRCGVGFIGAGNFASRVLIPEFRRAGADLRIVACEGGLSGRHAARRQGIAEVTTDAGEVIEHPEVDAVVIATRHDTHAEFVCRALEAGKHVFVEKPLAISGEQLERVLAAHTGRRGQHSPLPTPHSPVVNERGQAPWRALFSRVIRTSAASQSPFAHNLPLLHVGFNRRFAPHALRMAALLASVGEPKSFVMTVNAGALPAGHWTQDADVGGGRIVGEACHFIDLLRFLCGQRIAGVQATVIGPAAGMAVREDKLSVTLTFADGSFGTVHYLANGHRSFPKERLEVFCAGRVLQLDNFRRLRGYGWPRFRRMNLWRQDRGYRNEVQAFLEAIRTAGPAPIPFEEAVEVTRVSFDVVEAARTGQPIHYADYPRRGFNNEGGGSRSVPPRIEISVLEPLSG
ncbi:MAG TPA: bi-domain-containing oxidoreductase [Planctomycetaceae bacterium]|nr:bi-domain-containing oxidoreductase [Planctomycetaceae bacterium]